MKNLIFLIISALLLSSCLKREEVRRIEQMEGTWDVVEVRLDSVGSDGSHRTLYTGEDAGTFTFSPSFGGGSTFTEFKYDYAVRGQQLRFSGSATYDDEVERLQVYNENCGEIFNCDGMYDVVSFSRSRMEMTRYLPTGFIGQIQYLTIKLKKQ